MFHHGFVEHSVGNTVRKILHHIREEYNTASTSNGNTTTKMDLSISNFILQGQMRKLSGAQRSEAAITLKEDDPSDPDSFARALKPVLMEAIQDVLDELETVYDNISKSAKDHIHPECVIAPAFSRFMDILTPRVSEIILTIGHSKTVEAFLKSAGHYRNYTVIVAETGPSLVLSFLHQLPALKQLLALPDTAVIRWQRPFPQRVSQPSSSPIPQYMPSCPA